MCAKVSRWSCRPALGFVEAHYAGLGLDPSTTAMLAETKDRLHEHFTGGELQRLAAEGAARDIRQLIADAQEVVASLPETSAS